ncbi:MAG: hypothetical protein F6J93_00530 [Oscillatoria sp. SIO1A7]|nr:hypothetical protein [Oscillatoria sp. SIO1A7]
MKSTKLKVILGLLLGSAILGWSSTTRAFEGTKKVVQQVEAGNCQGSTELTYRSQQLRSPDGNSVAYYNATIRRVGQRGDRQFGSYCNPVGRETPVIEMVVESGAGTRRISSDPADEAYVISNPISFSPDSRYIVLEHDGVFDGGEIVTFYGILDSQNGYRLSSVSPCPSSFAFYQGFVSASEILFLCDGRFRSWEVFNLQRGSTRGVSQQYVNSAGKPQSYGTVVSEFTVVKKQVFPPR